MDTKEELEGVKAKQQEAVNRLNAIRQEEQDLLRELFRLEGEERAFERLGDNHKE